MRNISILIHKNLLSFTLVLVLSLSIVPFASKVNAQTDDAGINGYTRSYLAKEIRATAPSGPPLVISAGTGVSVRCLNDNNSYKTSIDGWAATFNLDITYFPLKHHMAIRYLGPC